jgi:hypothetical protein
MGEGSIPWKPIAMIPLNRAGLLDTVESGYSFLNLQESRAGARGFKFVSAGSDFDSSRRHQ